jgi:hypothetical protein
LIFFAIQRNEQKPARYVQIPEVAYIFDARRTSKQKERKKCHLPPLPQ